MIPIYILLLITSLISSTYADQWTSLGCFPKSEVSGSSEGSYIYQSSGNCEQECAGKRIAALINGNQCYCADSDPSNKVDNKNCNKPCSGYGVEMCGGTNYFTVYVNSDVDNEGDNNSSSSKGSNSSKTSSNGSSSTNNDQSTSSGGSSTTQSQSETTVVSTYTDSSGPGDPSVIYKTVIQTPSQTPTDPSETETSEPTETNSPSDKDKKQSKAVSGGTIAGAVVGGVAGVGIIAALIFLFIRYRRKKEEDEFDDIFTVGPVNKNDMSQTGPPPLDPFSISGGYSNHPSSRRYSQQDTKHLSVYGHDYKSSSGTSNVENMYSDEFAFTENNLSPSQLEYGRRKLSTGSLPDMIDRRPGSLKVVNN
ncbi:Cell wall integrity and stress response component 3 [Spathaspora sp. JA1]|nr:Cell wall integrity and stress response component 3 [Spathaspora sp. JA1]